MLDIAVRAAFFMVALALLLTLWRLARGPDTVDRVLALDTLYVNAVALLVLLGMQLRSTAYFEIALLIAALGFAGTVALCKYLMRGGLME
jgi:multicomponent K+:H+ antiporter subunit F